MSLMKWAGRELRANQLDMLTGHFGLATTWLKVSPRHRLRSVWQVLYQAELPAHWTECEGSSRAFSRSIWMRKCVRCESSLLARSTQSIPAFNIRAPWSGFSTAAVECEWARCELAHNWLRRYIAKHKVPNFWTRIEADLHVSETSLIRQGFMIAGLHHQGVTRLNGIAIPH